MPKGYLLFTLLVWLYAIIPTYIACWPKPLFGPKKKITQKMRIKCHKVSHAKNMKIFRIKFFFFFGNGVFSCFFFCFENREVHDKHRWDELRRFWEWLSFCCYLMGLIRKRETRRTCRRTMRRSLKIYKKLKKKNKSSFIGQNQ